MPIRTIAVLLILAGLGIAVWARFDALRGARVATAPADRPAPVELAAVERGRIVDLREFSGTLVAQARFDVAPKVPGRIESLRVDLGDEVSPGAVVAVLDDDEFRQAVIEAEAELQVAEAQVTVATAGLDFAERDLARIAELQQNDIASGLEFDVATAELRARRAEVDVARAQVQRAAAALDTARVRLGYATVVASWPGDDAARLVSQRYVDAGTTVAANQPLVTVVDVSTLRAMVHVTERDFGRLQVGQPATVRTDAWRGETFAGRVLRIAPVFDEASRQTRVDVEVPNRDRRLRPGMFVRVEIALGTADDATIVPEAALVRRDDGEGVFAVVPGSDRVRFVPVTVGIRDGVRVQVFAPELGGDVVTLGQQLLGEGARIRVPEPLAPPGAAAGSSR